MLLLSGKIFLWITRIGGGTAFWKSFTMKKIFNAKSANNFASNSLYILFHTIILRRFAFNTLFLGTCTAVARKPTSARSSQRYKFSRQFSVARSDYFHRNEIHTQWFIVIDFGPILRQISINSAMRRCVRRNDEKTNRTKEKIKNKYSRAYCSPMHSVSTAIKNWAWNVCVTKFRNFIRWAKFQDSRRSNVWRINWLKIFGLVASVWLSIRFPWFQIGFVDVVQCARTIVTVMSSVLKISSEIYAEKDYFSSSTENGSKKCDHLPYLFSCIRSLAKFFSI